MARETVRADASDTDQSVIALVEETKERFGRRRTMFEMEWFRNILFYVGKQWITYEDNYRRWRTRNLQSWVPLPVTNRLASTANVIRSNVAQVTPSFVAYPTKEDERSVLSANAADKYLEVIMQESGFRSARRRMASWATLTGNAFLLNEFDTSSDTGMIHVPGELCADCQTAIPPEKIPADLKCPSCGSANLQEDPDPAAGTDIPQGRIRTRALSPFEVYVDNMIPELEDQPMVLIVERRSLSEVKKTYGTAAADVAGDNVNDTARHFMDSLAQMTGSGTSGGGLVRYGTDPNEESVTLYRLYIRNHKNYPNGAYIVMTGDQHVLENKQPYPFRFSVTKRPFYPFVHVRYDDVPGRFWAKTPIDDLVPKQRQRNEMESLYQTIIMRCANPIWLIPSGVQTTPITGDPSIQVRFQGAGGAKPERLPGMDAPKTLVMFIQQIDQDFEEIANTFSAMKGKNPGSIRAASAIQMLIERGFGRYGSVFDNLEDAYEQWAIIALEMWKQNAVFPRVQAVAKAAGSWQFMEFMGSDIGEVDIRVESGSTRPRSQAGRQMLIGQALQWGLLNPQDPEQKMKIFEELGMTSLAPGAEADVKVVAEENAKFMAWAQQIQKAMTNIEPEDVNPQDVTMLMMQTFPFKGNPVLDHHPTHLVHHRRFALTEQFRSLPEPCKQLYVQHILIEHLPYLLQEATTGLGITSLATGMMQPQGQQPGRPGQSVSKTGSPQSGGGPGGGKPFGMSDPSGSGMR